MRARVGELLPQTLDVRVDGALGDVHVVRIGLAEQLPSRLDDPRPSRERLQQIELGERERQGLRMPPCLEAAQVEAEAARFDDLLLVSAFRQLAKTRAAQKRFDAGD